MLRAHLTVDEFARAFAAVGPDEAEELADAFSFRNCRIRDHLATILRRAAR